MYISCESELYSRLRRYGGGVYIKWFSLVHHDLFKRPPGALLFLWLVVHKKKKKKKRPGVPSLLHVILSSHSSFRLGLLHSSAHAPCQSEGRRLLCCLWASSSYCCYNVQQQQQQQQQQEKEKDMYYHPRSSWPLLHLVYCITFLSLLFSLSLLAAAAKIKNPRDKRREKWESASLSAVASSTTVSCPWPGENFQYAHTHLTRCCLHVYLYYYYYYYYYEATSSLIHRDSFFFCFRFHSELLLTMKVARIFLFFSPFSDLMQRGRVSKYVRTVRWLSVKESSSLRMLLIASRTVNYRLDGRRFPAPKGEWRRRWGRI